MAFLKNILETNREKDAILFYTVLQFLYHIAIMRILLMNEWTLALSAAACVLALLSRILLFRLI